MNFMKKYTIIVLILFVYMVGMTTWGYLKGSVTGTEALSGFAGMSVVLVVLWFLYRRREQYRRERTNVRKDEGTDA